MREAKKGFRAAPAVIVIIDQLYQVRYSPVTATSALSPGSREILISETASPEIDQTNLLEGVLLALEREGYLDAIKPIARRSIAKALIDAGYKIGGLDK